jgi:hypothetical protein
LTGLETPPQIEYRLLTEFRRLFEGKVYKHRNSSQGDFVAIQLFEDLVRINRSPRLTKAALVRRDRVLNIQNRLRGVAARRGDGTFGELIPGETPVSHEGYLVRRGPIATVEIGIEVKILAKAMIKQIDRVINDLRNQAAQFKRGGDNPVSIAIVGVNHAESMVGHEGGRQFPTTGRQGYLHPFQEAPAAERRLLSDAVREFDEFLILRFRATNATPYPFEWVSYRETVRTMVRFSPGSAPNTNSASDGAWVTVLRHAPASS